MSKSQRNRKKQRQRQASSVAAKPNITIVPSQSAPSTPAPEPEQAQPAPVTAAAPRPLIRNPWARFGLFYLFMAYMEIMFRLLVVGRLGGPGLLYGALFALPAAIALFVLCGAFSPKVNRRLTLGVTAAITVVYCAQLIYNCVFSTYFIFVSVLNGGEAISYYREILATIAENLSSLLLMLLPLLLLIVYGRKSIAFPRLRLRQALRQLATAGLCFILCLCSLLIYGTEELSPFDLFFKTSDVNFSVERLGLASTMQLDIFRTVTGFEADYDIGGVTGPPPTVVYAETPTTAPPTTVVATTTEPEITEPPFVPQPNVMEIDFEALSAAETDATLLEMHQYFSQQEPTWTNEKTGLYAGCNLIFIVAEGFSHYVIDPEITPTLHKMATEGFEFTNFYNPVWSVSTSDGEYVASQGLIPKSGTWSFRDSHDNWLPFQMGRALPRIGYSAHGYHNHSHTYYGRNLSHPNLGYDFKAVGAGLDMEPNWPESDHEMIDKTTVDYMGETPFHAYYMTVSGHLKYNFNGNAMAWRHYELTKGMENSEAVRAYISCNYELELAMELLLERLEEAGELENTVIVISADHYPYGLEHAEIEEIAGHEIDQDFELYRSGLIIYKAGTEHEVVDKLCSSLDILPTVSNLMGLEYDSRLLMGRDVFSDTEPLIIFSNRSFITQDARYNTRTKELIPNEGVELPEDYRKYWSNVINQKFTYSARILDKDYFRVLWPEEAAEAEAQDPWR